MVVSIFITLIGGISTFLLPGGAISRDRTAHDCHQHRLSWRLRQVVNETVATPLEQEINGVENMLYMPS